MIYLADAKEMKSVDSYSIQTLGIPSMVLMERAAYAAAVRINALLKERENRKVIAVCGSGNNGGDGLAIVRILHTMGYDAGGGFSDLLVELAGVLPYEAFLPRELE